MTTPLDIRNASKDGYWSALESTWTNLLTYRGPFQTRCRLQRGPECCGVQVDLVDVGNEGRAVAVGSAMFWLR